MPFSASISHFVFSYPVHDLFNGCTPSVSLHCFYYNTREKRRVVLLPRNMHFWRYPRSQTSLFRSKDSLQFVLHTKREAALVLVSSATGKYEMMPSERLNEPSRCMDAPTIRSVQQREIQGHMPTKCYASMTSIALHFLEKSHLASWFPNQGLDILRIWHVNKYAMRMPRAIGDAVGLLREGIFYIPTTFPWFHSKYISAISRYQDGPLEDSGFI